jgi:hypothetical protein
LRAGSHVHAAIRQGLDDRVRVCRAAGAAVAGLARPTCGDTPTDLTKGVQKLRSARRAFDRFEFRVEFKKTLPGTARSFAVAATGIGGASQQIRARVVGIGAARLLKQAQRASQIAPLIPRAGVLVRPGERVGRAHGENGGGARKHSPKSPSRAGNECSIVMG